MISFFVRRMLLMSAMCLIVVLISRLSLLFAPGFIIGCVAAIFKVWIWKNVMQLAVRQGTGALLRRITAVLPALTPVISFTVLAGTAFVDLNMFFGCALGMLSLPAIVLVNAFTEKICLTHNNWE